MRKYNVLVTSSFMIMLIIAIFGMISAMSGTGGPRTDEKPKPDTAAARIVQPDTVFEPIETPETEIEIDAETETEVESVERDTAENAPTMNKATYFSVPLSEELQDHIFELCEGYGIPPEIIIAQISRESCFDPEVVGAAGEVGYLQIHPVTVTFITGETGLDVSDPKQNISAGAWLLHYFIDRGYSLNEALICYNEGEGNASVLFGQGIYDTAYTADIYSIAASLRAGGEGE